MTDVVIESNTPAPSYAHFEFTGDGTEYFKIWIVNVLLTMLTLGIYSAWATVRNNRYFYSNLYLDDNSFKYLAEPLAILKGRIIAIIAVAIYSAAMQYSPPIAGVLAITLMISMPYFYNQSLAFKMRMSAYKGIQFRFKGSYGGAAMVLFVWPILGMLTLGILMPKSWLKMNEYIVNNSAYGTSPFKFNATYKDYAMIFLIMIGCCAVCGLLAWGLISIVPALAALAPLFMVIFYLFIFAFFFMSMTNLFYRSLSLVEHKFNCELTLSGFVTVMVINMLLTLITLGLYAPAAKVRMVKYLIENLEMQVNGDLDNFYAAEKENVSALGEEMGQAFDFA